MSINSDAKAGDAIAVQMPFAFQINVGIILDLFLFKHEIASMNIGTFDASPSITETINISSPFEFSILLIAAIASVAVIVPIAAFAFTKKRKGQAFPPPPPPPP